MKSIVIAGRLGKSAELRRTKNGDAVLSFSVAVDDGYGERKSTLWFDCSLWGKRGDSLESILTKGTPVTVSGDLGKREHEGKTYLTVRVNEVTLQGSRNDTAREHSGSSGEKIPSGSGEGTRPDLDDSIPFIYEWRI